MENANNNMISTPRNRVADLLLRRRRDGQALVILALFMMFLMGISGIVYDLGFARHELSRAQRAADAGALAGVVFMPEYYNTGQATAREAAFRTTDRHGYNRTAVGVSPVGQWGARLRVEITSTYRTAFMGIFGFSNLPLRVTAIAEYNRPIVMGAPEPYLGIGSDDPRQISRGGDPTMRLQGLWLSMHYAGTQKEYGDAFMNKWDPINGYNWPPGNGQTQPDYDNVGYSYGIYTPPGSSGYLQIYDAAYQAKLKSPFDATHPCGDGVLHPAPYSCSTNGPDFNGSGGVNTSRWCTSNSISTGDNQPGAPVSGPHSASQCSDQAQNNTTIYTLYYPDATPYYFADDQIAYQSGASNPWIVPASPVTGTLPNGSISPSFAFSDTWKNFGNAPNPGFQVRPVGSYTQWRLNVNNNPNDTSNGGRGNVGQNQYAIRVNTTSAGVTVFAIQRLPATNVLATTNQAQSRIFYLANIPGENENKTLIVSLFDPGDFAGPNIISLLAPQPGGGTAPVTFHVVTHNPAKHNPEQYDTARLDTNRDGGPNTNFNDEWIDLVYRIPIGYNAYANYWKIEYDYGPGGGNDRTSWRISIRGNPVHLVLGGS